MSGPLWYCTRQRAGPLVKECRALRPRLSASDSLYERAEKNKILRPPRDSSVCRTRVDRLEVMLALFGYAGSFYTLTFKDEFLPASFHETENVWRAFLRKLKQWLGRPFDYVYNIEGKHGDHRYHLHLVVRDGDFAPAELQYLWSRGWVDDEPLLRGPGDSFRRTARYMLKESTDGVVIPTNKRVCRWSRSLNRALPEPERFEARNGVIRIPRDAMSRGEYQTENAFGAYRYAWYIKANKKQEREEKRIDEG
ncbi:hypothetical protein [uncultured Oscillibacter sp.]|uniref:rolling circle replication-associated protein n=1 Tax=uncultured Oscillibacter sp. TaxID=876091 RepID=UPI00262339C1|nr:hypothetical protein [uncultured Oscillibacter sp.]